MNKKLLKELEDKLKNQKSILEKELGFFAEKDQKLEGDWDTKFPKSDGSVGSQSLESAADQVEDYVNLLPVEYNMELRLQAVNSALKKIKKSAYGKCEKCGKNIPEEKLKVYPEAKLCNKCH